MDASDVFRPDALPDHTYVERTPENRPTNEEFLSHQLTREGVIMSIAGPSKTGKSKLVEHVANSNDYLIIKVFGNKVSSIDEIWSEALDSLGEPVEREKHESDTQEEGIVAKIKGRTGFVDSEVSGESRNTKTEGESETHTRTGLLQLIDSVDTEKTIFVIEDFHNVGKDIKNQIGPALKEAS